MRAFSAAGVLSILLLASTTDAIAQCPRFGDEFRVPGGLPTCAAMVEFDDGTGPALYLGGDFANHGPLGLTGIARWDGTVLQPVGAGIAGQVHSLCVFDDGSGPRLIAGGSFQSAGGAAASNIAAWDGNAWSALGSGVDGSVRSLASFDDGSGPTLWVGGEFLNAGAVPIFRFANWRNGLWSSVANGVISPPTQMVAWDDGSGPALFLAGGFSAIGTLPSSKGFVRLQGSTWTALTTGSSNGSPYCLAIFDDGSGEAMYVGGPFSTFDGQSMMGIARWKNGVIGPVGQGLNQGGQKPTLFSSLTVHDDGTGAQLYAAGSFDRSGSSPMPSVARWNGNSWQPVGSGLENSVGVLRSWAPAGPPSLWASGGIAYSGTTPMTGTVYWDGVTWLTPEPGAALKGQLYALADLMGPTGRAVYAGGVFQGCGQYVSLGNIGAWNGSTWSALGTGVDNRVLAISAHSPAGQPVIVAGGLFTNAGGSPALRVAAWDGTNWSAMGAGFDSEVRALSLFDPDGAGPQPEELVAGGFFGASGPTPIGRVARWNGTSWEQLGLGLNGTGARCHGLQRVVRPDGTQRLYAVGTFTIAGSIPGRGIAVWDGVSWNKVGGDVNGNVETITAVDLGLPTGPALAIGGSFSSVNGVPAQNVALWDGTQWSAIGGGFPDSPLAIAAMDEGAGGGPTIFLGGTFTTFNGAPAPYLVRWDGTQWSGLGTGVDSSVRALAPAHDPNIGRDSLFVGGSFNTAGGNSSVGIARWIPCSFNVYCSAKTNSLGCVPSISASGVPSATSMSGFVVQVQNVLSQKVGLYVYGTTGAATTPFAGGTLCIAPPIRRSPGLLSGGNPPPVDCSGVYSMDFNAFGRGVLGGNPSPLLSVVGSVVRCQVWGRDQGFPAPDNATLSDALRFVVGP